MGLMDRIPFSELGDPAEVERNRKISEGAGMQISETKKLTRVARRAIKDAMRRGDSMAAFEVMTKAQGMGLQTSGVSRHGRLEEGVVARAQRGYDRMQGAAGASRLDDDVAARSQSQSKQADSSISPIGKAQQSEPVRLNERQQFAEDLLSSNLVQSGDPKAMERAFARGESLGVSREKTRGFLERKMEEGVIDASSAASDDLRRAMNNPQPVVTPSEAAISTRAIGDATKGMSKEGQTRLMEMAGKMGFSGQAAADWMSDIRANVAEQRRGLESGRGDATLTPENMRQLRRVVGLFGGKPDDEKRIRGEIALTEGVSSLVESASNPRQILDSASSKISSLVEGASSRSDAIFGKLTSLLKDTSTKTNTPALSTKEPTLPASSSTASMRRLIERTEMIPAGPSLSNPFGGWSFEKRLVPDDREPLKRLAPGDTFYGTGFGKLMEKLQLL